MLKQRSFNNGHIYVALSRVTSLNGLRLTGQLKRRAIKSNHSELQEYERTGTGCPIEPLCNTGLELSDTLTTTLLKGFLTQNYN